MNKKQVTNILLIAFFVGALGSIVLGRFVIPYLATFPGVGSLNKLVTSSPIVINRREEVQLNEGINLMELTKQSGNFVATILSPEGNFLGNGIIMTSDGMIFTNEQVIKGQTDLRVLLNNGQVLQATVRAGDPKSDLVVLTIDARNLASAQFDDASGLQAGQRVFALGRSTQSFVHKFATGFVVNPVRNSVNPEAVRSTETFSETLGTDITFDAELNGGAVFNLQGRVVGMVLGPNQVILAENMQTALSIYLPTGKITRPYLGVKYNLLSESVANLRKLPQAGALVTAVDKGSPAEQAGLRANDLIVEIEGQQLKDQSMEQLLNEHAVGFMKLKIVRAGVTMDLTVELIAK